MSEPTTLRDHTEPCFCGDHMRFQDRNGEWVCSLCPGGRERTFRQWTNRAIDQVPVLWVEVSDE